MKKVIIEDLNTLRYTSLLEILIILPRRSKLVQDRRLQKTIYCFDVIKVDGKRKIDRLITFWITDGNSYSFQGFQGSKANSRVR